jgi:hypothetical protein
MVLAFRNSLYRERLYRILCMPMEPPASGSPFAEGAALIKTPPSEPPAQNGAEEDDV